MKQSVKRIKVILTALMYVLIYYINSTIVYAAYSMYKLSEGHLTYGEIEKSVNDGSFALSVIASIVSLWMFMLIGKLRKKPLYESIYTNKVPHIIYVMAVCLALGCRLLVSVYYSFAQSVDILSDSIEQAAMVSPEIISGIQVLIALFCVMVVAPLFEELLFRGLVMTELMRTMRPWAAIFLQAIIFGVAHGVLFQSIFAIVAGVFLGILYYKTKSISVSVVCHSVFNFSAVLMQESMTVTGGIIYIAAGVLLIALSMIYIYSNSK